MLRRMPEYCQKFHCIAQRCKDNCCIGWEIAIDADTAAKYDHVEGNFGERLRNGISRMAPREFLLTEQERCPFLDQQNLCEIILNLGEDALCQICRDHPRYFEWFDGVQEGGIGMGCEEAARIILSCSAPFAVTETEIPWESADDYDPALYDCLLQARDAMIHYLENADRSFPEKIADLLCFAEQLQEHTDQGERTVLPILPASLPEKSADPEPVLAFLQKLEHISPDWEPLLAACCKRLQNVSGISLLTQHPETERYLQNIAVYFLWRYFLKGVFDEEFLSRVKLMAVSVSVIACLFWDALQSGSALTLAECAELAKAYSKEIEYSEENLNVMLDAAYFHEAFTTKALSSLLQKLMR